MKNLRKLLPGANREPKLLVVFSNRQEDCDRLIRFLCRHVANSPVAEYPIHVYCLEKPYEGHRCARVVVDSDSRRLYKQAQDDLANAWVALSATSWNNVPRGTLLKLIPLTLPPFRGKVVNENGDIFDLKLGAITRHVVDRGKQWYFDHSANLRHKFEVKVIWPLRHVRAWLRRDARDKMVWGTAVTLGQMSWFVKRVGPFTYSMYERLPKGEANFNPGMIDPAFMGPPSPGITRIEYHDRDWDYAKIIRMVEASASRFMLFCPPDYLESFDDFLRLFDDPLTFAVSRQNGYREWRPIMIPVSPFRVAPAKRSLPCSRAIWIRCSRGPAKAAQAGDSQHHGIRRSVAQSLLARRSCRMAKLQRRS